MNNKPNVGLVVTSIQGPVPIMQKLAQQAVRAAVPFVVIGDKKSPPEYDLPGADFYNVTDQHAHFGELSRALPENHYVRKNLGYLALLSRGVEWIVETDDDNEPLSDFLSPPQELLVRHDTGSKGWVNTYNYFSPSAPVWPRGFPLEKILNSNVAPNLAETAKIKPLLVQGLADANPDVDAVFRLTRELPVHFGNDMAVALGEGQWCPFNSQNTWFHKRLAPLLYLPTYCSFRMTDIWRSFVAQRCLWAMGEKLVFIAPTVVQERNEHNLLKDFSDEVPGYLNNEKIKEVLEPLCLLGDPAKDLLSCYNALVRNGLLDIKELEIIEIWLREVVSAASNAE